MFGLYFRPRAFKILKGFKQKLQLEINSALDDLKFGKFTSQDVKKVQDTKNGYRLRIGRWRILFILFSNEKRIEVIDIFMEKGKDDYRKRKKLL